MKPMLLLAAAALISGCTAQRAAQPAGSPVAPVNSPVVPGGSSSALLFDPPLVQYSPPVNLDRTGRGDAAFMGFEQTTTSTYDIWTYNNASTSGCDTYNRAAFVDRSGTLTR